LSSLISILKKSILLIFEKIDGGFIRAERSMADGDHSAPLKFGADKRFREGIIAMALSPRHDLLALATEASQVLLHRFEKLERVWIFEKIASFENNKISTLCWRDDGHVLAIAYYIDGSDAFYKLLDVSTGARQLDKPFKF